MPPICKCPICHKNYAQLSQHLRVTHSVRNKDERKLLLALESGRINVREGRCPVPGCNLESSRLDRHLKAHSELSVSARRKMVTSLKRSRIVAALAALRESGPDVPMVSALDLEGPRAEEEVPARCEEEEEEDCGQEGCRRKFMRQKEEIADLNRQVDTLASALREVSRRYRGLKRRFNQRPSEQVSRVTKSLLASFGPPEEEEEVPPPEEDFVPPTPVAQPSSSQTSSSTHPESQSPPHFPDQVASLNTLLNEFRRYQEGADPTPKLRENVGGKIYRIRHFLSFMAEGRTKLHTFNFLYQTARIRAWVHSLRKLQMAETTVDHYVKNVAQFIDYVVDTPPPTCRLSKNALICIRREVRSLVRGIRRKVTVHQMSVKRAKEGRLIPKSILLRCRTEAKKAIPGALDELESDKSQKTLFLLYGYITAYLASIYGHRCGVFQNMTIEEVEGASRAGKTFLINVNMHKTNKAFGPAQISLEEEEYDWFRRLLGLRGDLVGGPEAVYFFFTSTPNPCKNLNNYFQAAWSSMGLPGSPTFTDIRSSIATHARNSHGADDRQKVSRFMCHDTTTADKFYAANLNVKEAMAHRRLFEAALEGPDVTPEKPAQVKRKVGGKGKPTKRAKKSQRLLLESSTSEEGEPDYQESGVSASESESDEATEDPAAPSHRPSIHTRKRAMVVLSPLRMLSRFHAVRRSPSLKALSAQRSPTLESSSAQRSPMLESLSAQRSPTLESSSAQRSPMLESSSAQRSPTLESSSARRSLPFKSSPARRSLLLKSSPARQNAFTPARVAKAKEVNKKVALLIKAKKNTF